MGNDVRPNWDSPRHFVLACVSYAVGLGNVWRFPYLCQMHGGVATVLPICLSTSPKHLHRYVNGTDCLHPLQCPPPFTLRGFLIPYMIMLVLEGIPLFYMELAIGQKMRLGSIGAWTAISPYLGGVVNGGIHYGQAMCLVLAWGITYLLISKGVKSTGKAVTFTATFPYVVLFIYLIRGFTLKGAFSGITYMFTPNMEQLANPYTWINAATQIFFSLGLGFGSLIAFASYNQYNNNFERQAIMVSLINSGTSIFASIVTFSIYGFKATVNFENCLERMRVLLLNTFDLAEDSISLDTVTDWITKLNTTFPEEFAAIEHRIETCDLTNELKDAAEGPGLAFIMYSEAIMNMPLPQLWSVLYFIMLLLLGVGSMLGNITAIVTPLRDFKVISKMSSLVCVFCLLLGLGFTTTSGNYWFTIFNDYAATFSLLFIVLFEVIIVSYIYGIKRFEKDIEDMLGHAPNLYWKIMWLAVSPLLLICLLLYYIINYILGGTPTYQAWNKHLGKAEPMEYPVYCQLFIGLLLVSTVSCVPLNALYAFYQKRKQDKRRKSHTLTTLSA
ncbi:Sodium- and chloride-dependent transporter XTRP3 [Takifugu flavidus]|uniref:Sodium-and chloride-dependent transporter XTRP3 n=1 Tax=Takifugu flavidus TaxID=433684 RepID=A0A5C6PM01_9TELE|nr:Sodium- and chloride-dependent transporter XTRP3 [Takifugu flavidus]